MSLDSVLWRARNFGRKKNLPSLFILGAQKCGTSALYDYLVLSNNFQRGKIKEPGFFHRDVFFGATLDDYSANFKGDSGKCYIDATPENIYSRGALIRITEQIPNAKFVVMLRNPVDRAYSAWNHYRDLFDTRKHIKQIVPIKRIDGNYLYRDFFDGRLQFPSFEECIELELSRIKKDDGFEPSLLRRGLYLDQLQFLWDLVARENTLVVFANQLKKDRGAVLTAVEKLLDLPVTDWGNFDEQISNLHPYKGDMPRHLRTYLDRYYSDHNRALFKQLRVADWNGMPETRN